MLGKKRRRQIEDVQRSFQEAVESQQRLTAAVKSYGEVDRLAEKVEEGESRIQCPECGTEADALWSGTRCPKCGWWFCW